jgi:hypothetical protein
MTFFLAVPAAQQGATAAAWTTGTTQIAVSGQTQISETLNASFFLTGVQLEVGSVATNFELRPQQVELALCQRYFCRVSGPAATPVASGVATSTSNVLAYTKYPQAMRSTPTIAASTLTIAPNGGSGSLGVTYYGDNSASFNISGGTRTAGNGSVIQATSTSSYLDFSAEL